MFDKPIRFYDDDGTKVDLDLRPKPDLCISCSKDEDPSQEHLCAMNRFDQQDEDDFVCGEYTPKREDSDNTLG